MDRLILASASPRRAEILQFARIPFEVIPANVAEDTDRTADPIDVVNILSRKKANAVAAHYPDRVVLAADTVVVLGKKILEKPTDERDAYDMLSSLSGNTHKVLTSFTLGRGSDMITECVATSVNFRTLSKEEILSYIASKDPFDKAGAYGIQGGACVFVRSIDGDYFNVVGLPVCRVFELLSEKYPQILSHSIPAGRDSSIQRKL